MANSYSEVGALVALFLIVLAVLWFFLPFAIFGTKALIQQQIQKSKETNKLLKQIIEQSAKGQ